MNIFKINFITVSLLLFCIASTAHALEKNYTGGDEEVAAHDYIGIYMEIPEKVQNIIGMKTAKAEKSDIKEKVHLNGRVPQDVEDITDVYVSQRGILKECFASLGVQVSKDQVLCTMEADSGPKVIEVTAPTSGVIIAQFSRVGETADTVSPILTIADYSKLPVTFDVYEKDVGKIKMNQKVLVYSSAYPDKTFEGKVIFTSPRIDETTFTLKIRVLVDNPDYLLKPGMFVRGEAILGTEETHVAVPSYSVQNLDGIDVVFVQDEKESFIPTEVRVAYKDKGTTIVSGDVYEGNLIVTDGAYNLKSKIMESEIVGGCAHGH
jgi:multidrug efflux pump subunit AcrA (membrane-fusion protein)